MEQWRIVERYVKPQKRRKPRSRAKGLSAVSAHTDPLYRTTKESLIEELLACAREAQRRKRGTTNEIRFETNFYENVLALANAIWDKSYKPSGGIAFINYEPTVREIFGADFKDRVVHHFVVDKIYPFVDARLQPDSYSCRVGKGTEYGRSRLKRWINLAMQDPGAYNPKTGKKEVYVIKMDFSGYFMSMPRKKLFDMIVTWLERQYPEAMVDGKKRRSDEFYLVKELWKKIIFDDPVKTAKVKGKKSNWLDLPESKSIMNQPKGVGIVIGNLTSQLLSNMYLDKLDRFVKFVLKIDRYGRYVDDFFIVATWQEMEKMMAYMKVIERYVTTLGLKLNPTKTKIYIATQGVPFLGVIEYGSHSQMADRAKNNIFKAAYDYSRGDEKARRSLAAYRGFALETCSKKSLERIWEKAEKAARKARRIED